MKNLFPKENLNFSVKNTCKIFYCVLTFFITCNLNINAQNINDAKSEYKDNPVIEDNIRIVPEILFQGIEMENRSARKIKNDKLKRIEQSKTDKNQVLSDPAQEKLRQQQLDVLKTELIQSKKDKDK